MAQIKLKQMTTAAQKQELPNLTPYVKMPTKESRQKPFHVVKVGTQGQYQDIY